MDGNDIIKSIDESIDVKQKLRSELAIIKKICKIISQTINSGGTVYLCGNGGSAADAQHIAAEFVGKYLKARRPLPAVAFTTNTSILTAIGNDFGYEFVFKRQVEAMVNSKDVVVGISTSGNSPNVIEAISAAKKIGAKTIALTGSNGGKLATITDVTLKVPSNNTQRIQESHILIGHIICDIVEEKLVDV